jgi:hypothetical protein
VLEALARIVAPAIVLRGAALSILFYRDAGVRPMADLDMLVETPRVTSVVDGLRRRGWRTPTESLRERLRFDHSLRLENEAGHAVVIHWHAFPEGRHDAADAALWGRAVTVELLQQRACALAPSDSLLHTVVGGVGPRPTAAIRWIPDTMAILRATPDAIDWDELAMVAEQRRLGLRLSRGLQYLRELLDAPIPPAALQRLTRARCSRLERVEYRGLTATGPPDGHRRMFGSFPATLVRYLRAAAPRSFVRTAIGLPDYLRYHYAVPSRSQLILLILRQIGRRTRRLLVHAAAGSRS